MRKFLSSPFILFLSVHTFVWTLLPAVCRRTIPMDSLEAIVWGSFWELGTNKHPPLSGWLVFPFYELLWESPVAVYLLSQLCILFGFVFIYKLACLFLDKGKSVLAVMVLEGVIYYTITSAEYNVNIVSLALWPANVYYFYQALKQNKFRFWSLFGLFSALNILNKYVSGILFLPMLAFVLFTKEGRTVFKRFGAYMAVVIAIALCLPHFLWLWHYDFFTLSYFAGRATGKTADLFIQIPILKHFAYPFKFLAAQVLAGLGALLIFFVAYIKNKTPRQPLQNTNKACFLLFMGLGPVVVCFLLSLVTGVYLKSMWGTPTLYMLGIMLFYFFPKEWNEQQAAFIRRSVYAVMALFAVIAAGIYVSKPSPKVFLDSKTFAADALALWQDKYPTKPFAYVGGDVWLASNAGLYAKDKPVVVADDINNNPWLDKNDILTKGALLFGTYSGFCQSFSSSSRTEEQKFPLKIKDYFGKDREMEVSYCFVIPK